MTINLSSRQAALAKLPLDRSIFLEGPAGAGKTTAAVARLLHLLAEDVAAGSILVIVPQRTLGAPYTDALRRAELPPGGEVTVLTLGGLAQRTVDLFWPMVAAEAGFAHPNQPPVFLTLETAQYYMARVVSPLLDKGHFDSIAIDRNRLFSQILDNLNKAAAVGFAPTEIAARLKAAWIGESSQARVYDDAQACAVQFRDYCLAHNLLDFSLQYELFMQHLWPLPACRDFLTGQYSHLIVDNVEEDTPAAHDVLAEWLRRCRSALVVFDADAGYRRFLGADPQDAYRLKDFCRDQVRMTGSHVNSRNLQAVERHLIRALGRSRRSGSGTERPYAEELSFEQPGTATTSAPASQNSDAATPALPEPRPDAASRGPLAALSFSSHRFHPEMLDWVADEIASLVDDKGVTPSEIVVLTPFLSGALRFSLTFRLEARNIAVRSHRPSRALREEPATGCLLTLVALAHPAWGLVPSHADVTNALVQAIDGLDLVRAHLLVSIAYRTKGGTPVLGAFSAIEPEMQERITFVLGQRYERLRAWLSAQPPAQTRPPESSITFSAGCSVSCCPRRAIVSIETTTAASSPPS